MNYDAEPIIELCDKFVSDAESILIDQWQTFCDDNGYEPTSADELDYRPEHRDFVLGFIAVWNHVLYNSLHEDGVYDAIARAQR